MLRRLTPLLFAAVTALAADGTPLDFASTLEGIRQRHALPALGAAEMREGELVVLGVTGLRQAGGPTPVTTNDLWHMGSNTKAMTATLAGVMVDEGKARWDMKIAEALPELRATMHGTWKTVTLEMLLTHRSGAPAQLVSDPAWTTWRRIGPELAQRIGFIRSVITRPTEVPPDTAYLYSNQGYTIAGAMLERLAGKPYDQLLREKVFAPLGMKSCGFGGPGENQPRGHIDVNGAFRPAAPDADNPPAMSPAGRVHCSLVDFVRFASWHARGPLMDVKLMKDETLQKLHTSPFGQSYAMGWGVTNREWAGGTALNHNGTNTMWFATVWVAPAKKAAYVSVTNAAGEGARKACDEAITEMVRLGK